MQKWPPIHFDVKNKYNLILLINKLLNKTEHNLVNNQNYYKTKYNLLLEDDSESQIQSHII